MRTSHESVMSSSHPSGLLHGHSWWQALIHNKPQDERRAAIRRWRNTGSYVLISDKDGNRIGGTSPDSRLASVSPGEPRTDILCLAMPCHGREGRDHSRRESGLAIRRTQPADLPDAGRLREGGISAIACSRCSRRPGFVVLCLRGNFPTVCGGSAASWIRR